MIPLPTIQALLNPVPPKYASLRSEKADLSSRQLAVVEGSSVELTALCMNGKPLESVWLTVQPQGATGGLPQKWRRVGGCSMTWSPSQSQKELGMVASGRYDGL
jgi:hypothetical protein